MSIHFPYIGYATFPRSDFSLESEVSINDDDCCEGCEQIFPSAEITAVYSKAYAGGSRLLCTECAKEERS